MIFAPKTHKLFLFSALLFIGFLGCQTKTETQHSDLSKDISYLALGDSYTIGTSIDTANSWPMQLTDSLKAEGIGFNETQIIATNGWTTQDLLDGINDQKPASDFDMVSLLIGVNNQYQGMDINIYITQFRELLEQAIGFANGDTSKVFVVSIPNYGVTPFGQSRDPEKIRTELIEYNDIAKDISSEYDIPFINITPISELAAEDLSLLASDQLHPSAKMYSMWITEILKVARPILTD